MMKELHDGCLQLSEELEVEKSLEINLKDYWSDQPNPSETIPYL